MSASPPAARRKARNVEPSAEQPAPPSSSSNRSSDSTGLKGRSSSPSPPGPVSITTLPSPAVGCEGPAGGSAEVSSPLAAAAALAVIARRQAAAAKASAAAAALGPVAGEQDDEQAAVGAGAGANAAGAAGVQMAPGSRERPQRQAKVVGEQRQAAQAKRQVDLAKQLRMTKDKYNVYPGECPKHACAR